MNGDAFRPALDMLSPASIYVVIRLLTQGVVFVVALILAGLLPITSFAAIGSSYLIQAILTPIAGFALHSGLERLYFTYPDAIRPRKIFTIYVASFAVNTAVCGLGYIFLTRALRLEFLTDIEIAITIASTLLMSTQYVPIVVLRCEAKLREFALMQLAFVIVTQSLILYAVWQHRNTEAFFYGTLIGSIVGFFIWTTWLVRRTWKKDLHIVSIRDEFNYSLPSVPIGALEALQQAVDRYLLQLAVTGPHFASYTLALRFSSPLSTIAQGTKSALYPLLYRISDEKKIAAVLSDLTNISIAFFGALVHLFVATMAVIVSFMLEPEYRLVYPLFIMVIFGSFLRLQEVFLGVGADVTMKQAKKLQTLAPITVLQLVISIGLIVRFGLWGAASALVINGAARSIAMAWLGQRLLPRKFHRMEYVGVLICTAAPLALYLYLAVVHDRIFGPELLFSTLPILALAFASRGIRNATT